MAPHPHPWINNLTLYRGGKHGDSKGKPIILSANENPFGPSPLAIKALQQSLSSMHRYPLQDDLLLQQALALSCQCDSANIVIGNGSDELLSLLATAYAGVGDQVLYSEHGFLMYEICAKRVGATPIKAPEKNLHTDPEAFCAKANDKTRLAFIANPNNPTGSYLNRDALKKLHAGLPSSTLLVIDAAYAEYLDQEDYDCGLELAKQADNVVMTRSFSKIFGLAGLRLGWLYAPVPIAETLKRIRMPFNVNKAAQKAGLSAWQDQRHQSASREHMIKTRARLTKELTQRGFNVPASFGNFVLCGFKNPEYARKACDFLETHNIWVRKIAAYGLPDYLRISIGLDHEIDQCLHALDLFIQQNPALVSHD